VIDEQGRSRGTFEEFYRADHRRLLRLLMQVGASVDDAGDAAHEAYTRAWAAWAAIESPAAWVRVTALREYHKRAERSREELRRAQVDRRLLAPHLDNLEIPEEAERVTAAIARLPRRQAEVMALTVDDYKPREIAALLSEVHPSDPPLSANAVSAALMQARRRLREDLMGGQGGAR
jgi:RNA polymerase sigma-70 factor (ECF subfamily)